MNDERAQHLLASLPYSGRSAASVAWNCRSLAGEEIEKVILGEAAAEWMVVIQGAKGLRARTGISNDEWEGLRAALVQRHRTAWGSASKAR